MLYDLRSISRWIEQLQSGLEKEDVAGVAKAAKQLSSRRVAR